MCVTGSGCPDGPRIIAYDDRCGGRSKDLLAVTAGSIHAPVHMLAVISKELSSEN
jgi:hypothetical protein